MSILDLISIADPTAGWMYCWSHGNWGRVKIMNILKANSALTINALNVCIDYIDNFNGDLDKVGKEFISLKVCKHAKFTHSLNFILRIIRYSEGRSLFPLNLSSRNELISLQYFLQNLITSSKFSSFKLTLPDICRLLSNYSEFNENRTWVLCDAGVIEIIMHESKNAFTEVTKEDTISKETIILITSYLNVLSSILSTQVGTKYILLGRKWKSNSKIVLSGDTCCSAKEILTLAHQILKIKRIAISVKENMIKVCCQILSSPLGIHLCIEHALIQMIIQNLFKIEPNSISKSDFENLAVGIIQLLPIIEVLAFSYKGMFLLLKENLLWTALQSILPNLAYKGKILAKVISTICCSKEGLYLFLDITNVIKLVALILVIK